MECSGADADVCEEKLRSWRQKSSNCALLDLRDAYMQIGVVDECSKYQIVKFEGDYYMLRRLGFGLNCAPEIMKAVVSKVLSLDENIFKATDHYSDDIIIDLNIVSVEKVKEHLLRFGLATKPAESLCSAKVLGLQTYEKKGIWSVSPTGVTNIWCDASKIAYGVALERGDEVIEDGAWLQKLMMVLT